MNKVVSNGVAKVPVVMQMEALECGAACLSMILAYYGRWIALEQMRLDCGVSRDGSNAKNILKAARKYGLTANGYRLELDALREKGMFPCIVHWDYNHFIVLNGFRGNKAYVNDPSRGSIAMPIEDFAKGYTGIALMFDVTENFQPGGKRKSVLEFAGKRLKDARTAVIFTVAMTIFSYVFSVVNPFMSEYFMDKLLTGTEFENADPFLILLGFLAFVQIIVSWISAVYSLKIDGKLAINGSTSFMWKVLRLPMEFFSQRMSGDLMMRQTTNEEIASAIVNTFAPLCLNTAMMVFYLVVLIRYSVPLTILGVTTVLINLILSKIISDHRINVTRGMLIDSGKLATTALSGISMIETIKASGAENGFFETWANLKAKVDEKEVQFMRNDTYMGALPNMISKLANYGITFAGVYLAMHGQFTIGMITGFQGILASFMEPATTLTNAGQTLLEMRTEMERVEDVMEYKTDEFADRGDDDSHEFKKLSGNVEIRNVTFGYSILDEPFIKDFSMNLTTGKRVAIVGGSGCGKSTMSKLISGLYKPWSGEILFDGKSISEIDRSAFTGSVAVVDQDIILFEDTIENNIKMWDESIEDFEVIMAARDAQIHDDIIAKPSGYQYKLSEGGKDLSGGQRQRLEIARVLAMDPSIIILDEATSALDAKTEYEVVKAIKDRGITLIIIAHRLSTIRDSDEIIVLDKGEIVERGTHDELIKLGGYYSELVTND
ncbi:NHLP family bacteriocin export ABC transporter peptidase/permease/ATPase subunit [Butyrivibrio sp. CB08]|uniref:NHLP family bacteriocin export ABC transporter peptidase/permease/ATPase subunit n=1 Tax=Butyrivibrio sp. CB08 TaxID=2364879 RepID=UPI000EAAC11D|nr:NHLP family bacteriocin export ABC transporter peptidase/permease/ATPase subunit [Butyrivibrio sp. CB08]RKM61351.1 NHLP family bacteriocin export ABC transporter peptidase/permease/ATPase subunit [Butyrivibrio sp. CB08]